MSLIRDPYTNAGYIRICLDWAWRGRTSSECFYRTGRHLKILFEVLLAEMSHLQLDKQAEVYGTLCYIILLDQPWTSISEGHRRPIPKRELMRHGQSRITASTEIGVRGAEMEGLDLLNISYILLTGTLSDRKNLSGMI